jgi:hypothetical protein
VVNGQAAPPPVEVRAGLPHRFRFINISPLETRTVQLVSGATTLRWRIVAKDGAELPPAQLAHSEVGPIAVHAGETYDVEVLRNSPEPLALRITGAESTAKRWAAREANPRAPLLRQTLDIPISVK